MRYIKSFLIAVTCLAGEASQGLQTESESRRSLHSLEYAASVFLSKL